MSKNKPTKKTDFVETMEGGTDNENEKLMPAPKENRFWENRSKHGRGKIFETPEILKAACYEYFNWAVDNPLNESVIHGKDSKVVLVPKMRAFTLKGLCIFLGVNSKYFNDFEKALDPKKNETDKDFSYIITHVREIIFTQKFEGAAAGFLNPSLIAREIGLQKDAPTVNVQQNNLSTQDQKQIEETQDIEVVIIDEDGNEIQIE